MACFADINVSQGSVATYARCGGTFKIHLTANLPWNLSVIFFKNRLRFYRIMVMSLWPRFFWPTLHIFFLACVLALRLSLGPTWHDDTELVALFRHSVVDDHIRDIYPWCAHIRCEHSQLIQTQCVYYCRIRDDVQRRASASLTPTVGVVRRTGVLQFGKLNGWIYDKFSLRSSLSEVQVVFTARCYASAVLAMGLCPSVSVSVCVSLSQAGVLLKRLNVGSHEQHRTIPQGL